MRQPSVTTRHPWKRQFFIDTEFTDLNSPSLISIAIVAEDGEEFYAEIRDPSFDYSAFVQQAVIPQLGQLPHLIMSREDVTESVIRWMKKFSFSAQRPVLCYENQIDVDLLLSLIGSKPRHWALKYVGDRIDPLAMAMYFEIHGGQHHALHDARAMREAYK